MGDNVKVAVRLRPFNGREMAANSKNVVSMPGMGQTVITDPDTAKEHRFTFDYSYNSFDKDSADFCSQQMVWADIGVSVLENAYKGFNVSLFAYGQTGSGKSYSMMGYPPTPLNPGSGIIPIAGNEIFKKVNANEDPDLTMKVQCSMLEVYMEKVKDLFNPKAGELPVRENPAVGFYVDGLSKNPVTSFEQVEKWMDAGTKARTIASTNMNATSSRAHTIFQLVLTQTKVDKANAKASDIVSLINLIDLAGSERQSGTGAEGLALKQGCAINKSLSSLGNVISALAKLDKNPKTIIPYRDSVLTMLLKTSLGGNAKTIMIAALSPADINYKETLSTLQFADRAKQIKNKAVVNEDPNERMIRELKSELDKLRAALANGGVIPTGAGSGGASEEQLEAIRRQVEEQNRKELEEMRKKMEEMEKEKEKMKNWDSEVAIANDRMLDIGVSLDSVDESKKQTHPYFTNLNEDESLTKKIFFFFEEGESTIGTKTAVPTPTIALAGMGISKHHAKVTRNGEQLWIEPTGKGAINVNGHLIKEKTALSNYDRITLGHNHVFILVLPTSPPPENAAAIDFDFASNEMNAAAAAAFQSNSTVNPETEKKIKEMEEQLEEQKRQREVQEKKAQEEMEKMKKAASSAEEMKKAQEERQRIQEKMEEEMRKQKEEIDKLQRREERRKKERSLLDSTILKAIPVVNEANIISEEMHKNIKFSLKLLSVNVEDTEKESIGIYVNVNYGGKFQRMWPYSVFEERIFDMREVYSIFTGESSSAPPADDPFIDNSEQLIGKATVLTSFLYNILPYDEYSTLVDYSGRPVGKLTATISPFILDKVEKRIPEDDLEWESMSEVKNQMVEFDIDILDCCDIPKDFSKDVRVQYKWFLDEDFTTTDSAVVKGSHHKFEFKKTYKELVTDELINYLENGFIVFEVYGSMSPSDSQAFAGTTPRMPAGSPMSPMSGESKYDFSSSIVPSSRKPIDDSIPVSNACSIA